MIGVNASVVGREGIPLTEINKTHTSISGIELDSFLITYNNKCWSNTVGWWDSSSMY